jgi:hypothetical protein
MRHWRWGASAAIIVAVGLAARHVNWQATLQALSPDT